MPLLPCPIKRRLISAWSQMCKGEMEEYVGGREGYAHHWSGCLPLASLGGSLMAGST